MLFFFWLQFSYILWNPGKQRWTHSAVFLACTTFSCHRTLMLLTVYSFSCCEQFHLNVTQWFGLNLAQRSAKCADLVSGSVDRFHPDSKSSVEVVFEFWREYEPGAYFTPRHCSWKQPENKPQHLKPAGQVCVWVLCVWMHFCMQLSFTFPLKKTLFVHLRPRGSPEGFWHACVYAYGKWNIPHQSCFSPHK